MNAAITAMLLYYYVWALIHYGNCYSIISHTPGRVMKWMANKVIKVRLIAMIIMSTLKIEKSIQYIIQKCEL